jgi:hypothetical protein
MRLIQWQGFAILISLRGFAESRDLGSVGLLQLEAILLTDIGTLL